MHSVKLAHAYSGLSPKTLDRDLNWLIAEQLVVHSQAVMPPTAISCRRL